MTSYVYMKDLCAYVYILINTFSLSKHKLHKIAKQSFWGEYWFL